MNIDIDKMIATIGWVHVIVGVWFIV